MKKLVAFAVALALTAGFLTVPVLAGEMQEHDHAAEIEAQANMYSPNCPTCDNYGEYLYEVESVGGHRMVYMRCSQHGLYHYFT